MDDAYWSAIKLILFPKFSTVFDIYRLVKNCDKDPRELLKSRNIENLDLHKKLICLAISRFRPIIRRRGGIIIVREQDIRHWIDTSLSIIETLIGLDENEFAKAMTRNFISTYFYLLTVYALWRDASPATRKFLMIGKFEDKALEALLEVISEARMKKVLEKLDMEDEFGFSLATYAYSLSVAFSFSGRKEKLEEKLGGILSFREDIDAIIEKLKDYEGKNMESIRQIISDVVYLVGNMVKISVDNKDLRNSIARSFGRISEFISRHDYLNKDIVWNVTKFVVSAMRYLLDGQIENFFEAFRECGKLILMEKISSVKISERLIFRVLPEIQAFIPTLVSVPINLSDTLTSISPNHLLNDLISEVLGCFLETKMALASMLIVDLDDLYKSMSGLISDPLASVPMIFVVGAPSAWLLETAITISGMDQQRQKITLEKTIKVLGMYIKMLLDITKDLIHGPLDFSIGRKIGASHLLREVTFLTLRLSEEVIKIIKSIPGGKRFLNIIDEATKVIEEIYGRGRIVQEEKIEELIV